MKRPLRLIGPLLVLVLGACSSSEVHIIESAAPVVRPGGYGTRKVVNGVDIWTFGEPARRYQVLGIINDDHTDGTVANSVKKAGGNAVIKLTGPGDTVRTTALVNAISPSFGTIMTTSKSNETVLWIVVKYL